MAEAKATAVPRGSRRIPRACSNVFRLWASVGLGILVAWALQLLVDLATEAGWRGQLSDAELLVERDFGGDLLAWIGFSIAYLWLGLRAFAGVDHAELVRRIEGSPLPRSAVKRWLLAGGGGISWPLLISIWAFATVVSTMLNRDNLPPLTLLFAGFTVLSCIAVITFSFALHYARKDVEEGGLEFSGPREPVFGDYLYLSIGCSVTFGTTDTGIHSSSMRRIVSIHGVLAWMISTVVIAVLLSLITN
jgi:uncharacterized membrane protein